MKLYHVSILYKRGDGKNNMLASAFELTSFGFFQRSSVREFMQFTSDIIIQRTGISQRASVQEQDYMCHAYVRGDSLSGVVITDIEYPQEAAFTLINKALELYSTDFPPTSWAGGNSGCMSFPPLDRLLQKYQNPSEADATN